MAEQTKIQWATHTFNPWRGCVKIAPGCANCYADRQSKRKPAVLGIWGSESSGATRVVAAESYWQGPARWNANAKRDHDQACRAWELAEKHGKPGGSIPHERPRVFCASLADVFEDWQGRVVDSRGRTLHRDPNGGTWYADDMLIGRSVLRLQDVRSRLFRLIDATPNLDWLLLTKRPENVRRMWPSCDDEPFRRPNVWLGVSCSTQEDCDRLIPELLKYRGMAAKMFVSLEPLVEHVDLLIDGECSDWACPECGSRNVTEWPTVEGNQWKCGDCGMSDLGEADWTPLLDWVIVGGESGPNARPYHLDWARAVIQQCKDAGVPCFHKQLGSNAVHSGEDLWVIGVRDSKSGDMDEWPEDLRVREVPNG